MKGIVLAGGEGTRLYPLTAVTSKHLLPIYDKPMIYYSLSVLMLAGIREVLIISTPRDLHSYQLLFGNGKSLGLNIEYVVQESAVGIPDAFIIGEQFIGTGSVMLILGDNIVFGQGLSDILRAAIDKHEYATIFGYKVKDPQRFGVVELGEDLSIISIEEKPLQPKSNYAVTGLYIYDNSVIEKAKSLKRSSRGELEITDINQLYLNENKLDLTLLGRGLAWLDTGTFDALLNASQFVEIIETRQGMKIACIEEIAYRLGYISKDELINLSAKYKKSIYGMYLLEIAEEHIQRL